MHFFGIFVPRTAFLCRVGHGGGEQEEVWLDSEINKRRGAKGERERRKEARREARSRRKKAAPPPPNLALRCVVHVDYENSIVNTSGRGHR